LEKIPVSVAEPPSEIIPLEETVVVRDGVPLVTVRTSPLAPQEVVAGLLLVSPE
jgi:hypothetical protein